jgi:tetratricopeptide (TPR) repeat protein
MAGTRCCVAVVALLLVGTAPGAPASAQETPDTSTPAQAAAALCKAGVAHGYNLDHDQALAAFARAMEIDPDNPAPHRLTAATLWIQALFLQGAVTVDDYLGQARTTVARKPPPPALAAAFRRHIARALILSEKRLRANPADADAHFQYGAAHGFMASYTATVEGGVFAGFKAARRAFSEHERVMELDPGRKDAGLIVGLYRYSVSRLPVGWRLLAGLAGIGGGRERGLRLVEDAAAHANDVQSNARFTLIAIYNREARYDDALRVIGELQRGFPRNRLLWLEAGSTALRAGRAAEARKALEIGLNMLARDGRPRAYGEEARWRYAYGASLVLLRAREAAERELRAALRLESHDWVRGRIYKELGKLADLAGNHAGAVEEYRLAIRLGRADRDTPSADEAARLIASGYR